MTRVLLLPGCYLKNELTNMNSTDEVADAWDANAEVWSRHVRAGYDTFRLYYNNPAFFALVGDLQGRRVLDAGCGEGYNTRLFARQGADISGIDIAPQLIASALAEEARDPLGIRYAVASAGSLPFPNSSFDVVVSTMALMDCACYEEALTEFYRVLCPAGLLAFSILHPCFSHRNILGWEQDACGEIVGIRLGNYFQPGVYTESWQFGMAPDAGDVRPFTIHYFNRTLTETINPLCVVGFHLEAIEEPQPSLEACRQDARLTKHRLIPQTLLIKARKPA